MRTAIQSQALHYVLLVVPLFTSCGGEAKSQSLDGGLVSASERNDSSSTPAPEPRRICDGSDQIRFAFRYVVIGTVTKTDALLYQLGWEFLYVDGRCHYWVQAVEAPGKNDPFSLSRPYRTGTLTADEEQALHDAVGYDDFAHGPAAEYCTPPDTIVHDAAVPEIWDGQQIRSCPNGGFVPPTEDWLGQRKLYKQGTELTGAVRVVVDDGAQPLSADVVYPWPFRAPPEELVSPVGVDPSSFVSHVIPEEEALALRELRDQVIEETSPQNWHGGVITEPEGYMRELGFTFMFAIRDELPFTDALGRWSAPQ